MRECTRTRYCKNKLDHFLHKNRRSWSHSQRSLPATSGWLYYSWQVRQEISVAPWYSCQRLYSEARNRAQSFSAQPVYNHTVLSTILDFVDIVELVSTDYMSVKRNEILFSQIELQLQIAASNSVNQMRFVLFEISCGIPFGYLGLDFLAPILKFLFYIRNNLDLKRNFKFMLKSKR